jgi:hypothetical protein
MFFAPGHLAQSIPQKTVQRRNLKMPTLNLDLTAHHAVDMLNGTYDIVSEDGITVAHGLSYMTVVDIFAGDVQLPSTEDVHIDDDDDATEDVHIDDDVLDTEALHIHHISSDFYATRVAHDVYTITSYAQGVLMTGVSFADMVEIFSSYNN